MSNYYYENGANHYDHHKEVTVNFQHVADAKALLRELWADDIEEAVCEETDKAPEEAEPTPQATKKAGGGRKAEGLFADEATTEEQARRFKAFLNRHNHTGHRKVNTQRDNYINKAMVAFLIHWKRNGLTDFQEGNFKGRACYKFLTARCGIESEVSIETYNSFFIGCMRDEKYIKECKESCAKRQ
ncbi:MAG: hypothetical protein SOZ58_05425 [Prevotella sp.]|nr:hypothetical protein [Prevotella sp.]